MIGWRCCWSASACAARRSFASSSCRSGQGPAPAALILVAQRRLLKTGRVAIAADLAAGGFRGGNNSPSRFLSSKGGAAGGDDEEEDKHRLFREQTEELKEEREALFGFTDDERDAWSNQGNGAGNGSGSGLHRHDASFLDQIERARIEADEAEKLACLESSSPLPPAASADDSGSGGISSGTSKDDAEIPRNSSCSATAANDGTGSGFSHVARDEGGRGRHRRGRNHRHRNEDRWSAKMVDVGEKVATRRVAVAESRVVFPPEVVREFGGGNAGGNGEDELVGPKGPIFSTAKLAGIMAAKKTSDLIPLCHPLPLDQVDVDIRLADGGRTAVIQCACRVTHRTGVEMEALTGATVAALTVYDMCKAVSHRIRIEGTVLLSKSGGRRDVKTTTTITGASDDGK